MTATQMKRIRKRLNDAARLTDEAHEIAREGHADYDLIELTARAADDTRAAIRALEMRDQRMRMNAEAIARDIGERE